MRQELEDDPFAALDALLHEGFVVAFPLSKMLYWIAVATILVN
jgi:hypothetical protein